MKENVRLILKMAMLGGPIYIGYLQINLDTVGSTRALKYIQLNQ
jgi:hypothetical protein